MNTSVGANQCRLRWHQLAQSANMGARLPQQPSARSLHCTAAVAAGPRSIGAPRRSRPEPRQHVADSTTERPSERPRPAPQPWRQDWSLPTGLSVTWMGTSSGAPTTNRNVSGTLVRMPSATYLVDCGEGSHRQLSRTQVDPASIERIFVTHLHGDHCFGLAQMLAALDSAKRKGSTPPEAQRNYVYGPPGTVELLQASLVLTSLQKQLQLPLTITELVMDASEAHAAKAVDPSGRILVARQAPEPGPEAPDLQHQLAHIGLRDFRHQLLAKVARNQERARQNGWQQDAKSQYSGANYVAQEGLVWRLEGSAARVTAAQLQHRVPCWGYVFDELPEAAAAAAAAAASAAGDGSAAAGEQAGEAGSSRQRVKGLLGRSKAGAAAAGAAGAGAVKAGSSKQRGRRVVILGDTIDSRAIGPIAYGADLLSHEATFAQGMEDKCCIAQHSAAWMAGEFAATIKAKQLVLTHFSARYDGAGRDGFRAPPTEGLTVEEEEQMQQKAIYRLLKEAQRTYKGDSISAATDFYTVHVPHRTD